MKSNDSSLLAIRHEIGICICCNSHSLPYSLRAIKRRFISDSRPTYFIRIRESSGSGSFPLNPSSNLSSTSPLLDLR